MPQSKELVKTAARGNPVLASSALRLFRPALLRWFDRHRRLLPWRSDRHPYRVWVSEIMLQQTRVAAVLDHYARFLDRFPSVEALAAAPEASVLAAWSGLGYYRRARALHAAARQLTGPAPARPGPTVFPTSAAEWQTLPGIGRYTAAAISSICFDQRCAVVDGNVERVLDRLFGALPDPWPVAALLLSPSRPGDFNQAMMELGALVCQPRQPLCPQCPVARWCSTALALHPPPPVRPPIARRKVQVHHLLARRAGRILLTQRRPDESLMPGMWELPASPPPPASRPAAMALRHSILNTDYRVTILTATPAESTLAASGPAARWFTRKQALALPLTGLARKVLLRLAPAAR